MAKSSLSLRLIQDKKVKLRVDVDEESEERGGIAYVSFDETAFDEQGPEGITMGDPRRIEEIVCRVPLFEKFQQLGVESESKVQFYKIVRHQSGTCTLEIQDGDEGPRKVINDLRDSQRFHLLVVGSPILGDRGEFLGIVDFVEVDKNSLLELVFHGIIQKTPTGRSQDSKQETTDGGQTKLSPADPLQLLWNYIDFRDQLSSVLDVKYVLCARSKYWPHLAEQFGIPRAVYDSFSTSDISSPTEELLGYLEATRPEYSVKEFWQDCETIDAYEVSRIIKENVKAGILDNADLVSEICDKAPAVLDEVLLKLDRGPNPLWENLARKRKIPRKIYIDFQSDKTINRARLFFDVLRTQRPGVTVGDLRKKSTEDRELEQITMILERFEISDHMILSDLSEKNPDAKIAIESFLNRPKAGLWKLASRYRKEGLMVDIELETVFRQQEVDHSPTCKLVDYITTRLAGKPCTIEDLIIKLWNINRKDCHSILEPYLRRGMDDIDGITKALKKLECGTSNGENQPSTWDDTAAPRVPVSESSEQAENKYIICNTNTS